MRNKVFLNSGFTLIELLVVTAVVGVLGVLCATLISSILRSQNKTAIIMEVRQNGDQAISEFERDIKQSESVQRVNATDVQLKTFAGETIDWTCDPNPPSTGTGNISRSTRPVINTDSDNGVKVTLCDFEVAPLTHTSGVTQLVTWTFTLAQRSLALRTEFQVSEQFETTVGTRAY